MDYTGCNDQIVRGWLEILFKRILLRVKRFEVDKIISRSQFFLCLEKGLEVSIDVL